MAWSWSNPSQDEAEEAYQYYKSKYYSAAARKRESEKQEQSYIEEKKSTIAERDSTRNQKLNFEKRVEGIEKIIKLMEGNSGWFSANVPEAITKAQQSLSRTDSSFRSSMKLSGAGGAASLEKAFKVKTVEEDRHSASALAQFKAEKARLEEEISNLNRQIDNLSGLISSLTGKINACNAEQASLRSAMNSYAYDMNHYKKFTY